MIDEWVTLSQTFIRHEVAELRRQGVHVEVVALEHRDTAPASDEAALILADLAPATAVGRLANLARRPAGAARLLRAQARMRPERIRYRATLPAVADRLRAADIQWVHAHFGWEASGVAEALAALLGVGWSFTAHANDIFVANQHLAGKLARVDHLVTVCQYNLDQLRTAHAALPPTEIVVCGVELPETESTASPTDRPVDVLAVGRLVPKKGFDLLVRATQILRQTRPGLRVEIVGDGPEHDALAALVEELSLEHIVQLVGRRDHDWVLDRMRAAQLVCLPARVADDGDRDSMPVVLKEAMARSVPVVATDVAGIPEMVDGTVGRLVPPEDADALARALHELLGDDALRAHLGAAARQRVSERFTLTGEVARLRRHFEDWTLQEHTKHEGCAHEA